MKVQIIVEYKGATYESVPVELSDEIKGIVESTVAGRSDLFMLDTQKADVYFPRKVLDESIISIYRCE